MTPNEFRIAGHRLIDWIADYRARVAEYPVMAQTEPGAIKAQLPAEPPEEPVEFVEVFRDLDQILVPGLSHFQHPHFFGYFPSNAGLSSVLGDYLSSGLGVLGLSWQACPALTELEEVVVDWCRQMLGLSTAWSGVIQDTTSASTLVALACARERSSDFSSTRGGLQNSAQTLIVYTSDQSHSSVVKAAVLAGFGRENVRLIGHDSTYALNAQELAAAIGRDMAEGLIPCAIVATVGTTASTAVDPIAAIADIARTYGIWLHVDAAMAGSAMILPECRWMWDGIELADSLVLGPHKWLGVAFDCSLYYVRDADHLIRVMSTNPSYLQSSADGKVKNLRDWGIPLGRRFRALKLWCLIRAEGVNRLQTRLRRDLANAQWLVEQVRNTSHWKILAPVHLQTLCVRYEPPEMPEESVNPFTLAWAERVNSSGAAYLTPATLDGRWMVRVSIGAEATERRHVERLWEIICQATHEVRAEGNPQDAKT